ncbi:MAG: amidophosphoribosyltransferase [Bacteroidales bacterium]|nr:amidophosphoribosyltransferase [Bacteroidales bacterium]
MEILKHECGVAMIRLLKPASYYKEKYGSDKWGTGKLYLMMEKQHNRGQEGAGIASVHLEAEPGEEYMFRHKALGKDAISEIFAEAGEEFAGELLMGHLRYSTTGKKGLTYVHPFLRRNNWRAKNLCICGNFNMTNIDEVFDTLAAQGQYPRTASDSYIMLEEMGHRLDREVERNFSIASLMGLQGRDITNYIDSNVDITKVLKTTMSMFDGGYVVCGLTGSGEFFAMRDPWGIRPAFYCQSDEVVALASERPVLQTTFNLSAEDVQELAPGSALIVRRNGNISIPSILAARLPSKACSFERIYFSRGNDFDIYRERKQLGEQLVPAIEAAVDGDIAHTVFSYIPNTAEVAYYGMLQGLMRQGHDVRFEKIAWKDIKMRTFIAEGEERRDLAAHVYDITYGVIAPGVDNLVIIDDSIVRGTTLRESIIKILDRLHPKKIVIVSSAPQIRYPDFYGIDMPRLEEFIAFRACIALLEESGRGDLIKEVYEQCKAELLKPALEQTLPVKRLYEPFSEEELNRKMVEILRPEDVTTPIEIVFQTIDGLHRACPDHHGDWYFTGDYPTPGGIRLANTALVQYFENR